MSTLGIFSGYQDLVNLSTVAGASIQLTDGDPYCPVFTDANQILTTQGPMANGQLIVGAGLTSLPSLATLTPSANMQVTNGAGSITLDTIQGIQTSSSPQFTGLTLSGLSASMPIKTNASKALTSALISLTGDVSGVLPIISGGTNSLSALTNGKLMVSSSGSIIEGTSSSDPTFNAITANTLDIGSITISGGLITDTLFVNLTSNLVGHVTAGSLTVGGDTTLPDVTPGLLLATTAGGIIQEVNIANSNGCALSYNPSGSTLTASMSQDLSSSGSPTFVGETLSGLTATRLTATDGSKALQSVTISNSNGSNFSFAGSTLTSSLSQDLQSSASPTFVGETLSGLTATRLTATDGSKALQSVQINNSNGCNSSFATDTLDFSMTQDLSTAGSVSFSALTVGSLTPTTIDGDLIPGQDQVYNLGSLAGNRWDNLYVKNITMSSLTGNAPVYASSSQVLKADNAMSTGQVFGGKSSGPPQRMTMTSTANQVTVTSDATSDPGTITFSTPQNINTTANFQANTIKLNDVTTAARVLSLRSNSSPVLTSDRTLSFDVNDANRIIDIAGDITTAAAFTTSGANALTLTTGGVTNATIPSGTITLADLTTSQVLTNKTLTTPVINGATLSIDDSDSAFNLSITSTSTLTGNKTLTLDVDNADRKLELGGDVIFQKQFRYVNTFSGETLQLETTSNAANVWTFPSNYSSGTFVSLSGDDLIGNKRFTDNNNYWVDSSDPTKKLAFECSGITTATTRTLAAPNFDGTIATLAGTETLTNKKLTDSSVTFADDGDTSKQLAFQCSGISTATTRTVIAQNSSGTMGLLEATQTWTGTNSFSNTPLPTTTVVTDLGSTSFRWRNLIMGRSNGIIQLGTGFRTTNRAELLLFSSDPGTNNIPTDFMMGNEASGSFQEDSCRWDLSTRGTSEDQNLVFFMGPAITGVSGNFTRCMSLVGESATKGNVIIGTSTTSSDKLRVEGAIRATATTNQLILAGPTRTLTLNAAQPATSSRVVGLPDPGADCDLVYTASAQTIGGAKTMSSALTINPTTNQLVLGITNTTTISSVAPAASRTLTIRDPLAAADIVLSSRGTVTQLTSITTAVTLNAYSGVITTVSASTAALNLQQFTLNNSVITTSSVILMNMVSYSGTQVTNGVVQIWPSGRASGSVTVNIYNAHASNALSGTITLAFLVC